MIAFRIGQMAKEIGVHRNTIKNWINSGKLAAKVTAGRRYLIAEDDLRHFLAKIGSSETPIQSFSTFSTNPGPAKPPILPKNKKSEEPMSTHPIGSVLVVGGGIAGIQASLDLANSGYSVHLVERSAGIGGVMAQLDKTYPTNDCAM
jgi:excisionase family DNA binding protein